MRLQTWNDFEKSFEKCEDREKPHKFFVGLFCKEHRNEFDDLMKRIGKLGWGRILGKNYWINYDHKGA